MLFAPNAQESTDECDAGTRKRNSSHCADFPDKDGGSRRDTALGWPPDGHECKGQQDDWELQRTSHDTVDWHSPRESLAEQTKTTVAERLSDRRDGPPSSATRELDPSAPSQPTVTKIGGGLLMEFSPARRRILPNREVPEVPADSQAETQGDEGIGDWDVRTSAQSNVSDRSNRSIRSLRKMDRRAAEERARQRAASRQQNEETEMPAVPTLDLVQTISRRGFQIASEDSPPSPSRTTPAPSGADGTPVLMTFSPTTSRSNRNQLGAHAGEDVAGVNSRPALRAPFNLKLLEHTYQSAEDAKVEELRKRKLHKLEALQAQRRAGWPSAKTGRAARRDLAEGEGAAQAEEEQQQQQQQQQQPLPLRDVLVRAG